MTLEKELETAKIALVNRSDFNLEDAFRIFDTNSNRQLTHSELKYGLNDIGVFPSSADIDLYIKRYDSNHDGRLTF